jgi:hypothetical protein
VAERSDAALRALYLRERSDESIFGSVDVDHPGLADILDWILSGRRVVARPHSGCIADPPLPVRDRASVLSGRLGDLAVERVARTVPSAAPASRTPTGELPGDRRAARLSTAASVQPDRAAPGADRGGQLAAREAHVCDPELWSRQLSGGVAADTCSVELRSSPTAIDRSTGRHCLTIGLHGRTLQASRRLQ